MGWQFEKKDVMLLVFTVVFLKLIINIIFIFEKESMLVIVDCQKDVIGTQSGQKVIEQLMHKMTV